MHNLTKQQISLLSTRLVEFQNKFSSMSKEDRQWVIQNTSEAIKMFIEAVKNRKIDKSVILKLIFGDQPFVIKALDGSCLIHEAEKTFKSYIDPNFVDWGLNKTGIATPETQIRVDEVVGEGTFMNIFGFLPATWNQKWLSQNQVIEFCETLHGWLRQDECATMFLCKIDENKSVNEEKPQDDLVVVFVDVISGGLDVDVFRLDDVIVWGEGYRYRVVSPQLVPLEV